MTFKERDDYPRTNILIYDDPTGGAGMQDQSALNDREVQRHRESGDKHAYGRIDIRT